MARTLLCALLTLILTLMSGCSDPQPPLNPTLLRADSLMEPAPDSALALLDTIDRTIFLPADSNLYALLLTQAAFKNDRPLRSDTLIRRARRAYRRHGPHSLRRRAAFYSALSYYRRGHLPSAMSDALNAYELSKSESNPYWTAKSAELIADIFDGAYNYKEAEPYRIEAIDLYLQAGKIPNHRYAICDHAAHIAFQGRVEEGLHLIDSIRQLLNSEAPFDSDLNNYAIRTALAIVYDYPEKKSELSTLYEEYIPYDDESENLNTAIFKSFATDSDLEINLPTIGDSSDSLHIYDNDIHLRYLYAKYCLALSAKNYREAANLTDSLLDGQSQVVSQILSESVMKVQSDYFATQSENRMQKIQSLQSTLLTAIILGALIVILIIIIYRILLKNKEAEIHQKMDVIMSLKEQSEHNEDLASVLFAQNWSTLNMLCEQYARYDGSDISKKNLLNSIIKEIDTLTSEDNLDKIHQIVNKRFRNIINQLGQECQEFSTGDLHIASLTLSGLSTRAISLVLNIKPNYYYQKKKRLIDKIKASSFTQKSKLIELLQA